MSRPLADPAERLLASDATDFERRVLEATLQDGPSPAASARMARALGLTAAAVGMATAAKTLAVDAATSEATATATATAATGGTTLWPWISAGVLGLAIAGAVVGTRTGRHGREPQVAFPAAAAPRPLAPPPRAAVQPPPASVAGPPHGAVAPGQRGRATPVAGDLGDQVGLLDSARAAMSGGADRRALEILRRYQDRYPTGSFRPEALALKVEVLMKLGREAEARDLAGRFVTENRGSLLARRVAELAGLAEP